MDIVTGIFCWSLLLALSITIGSFTGRLTARLFRFTNRNIEDMTFFGSTISGAAAVIGGIALVSSPRFSFQPAFAARDIVEFLAIVLAGTLVIPICVLVYKTVNTIMQQGFNLIDSLFTSKTKNTRSE